MFLPQKYEPEWNPVNYAHQKKCCNTVYQVYRGLMFSTPLKSHLQKKPDPKNEPGEKIVHDDAPKIIIIQRQTKTKRTIRFQMLIIMPSLVYRIIHRERECGRAIHTEFPKFCQDCVSLFLVFVMKCLCQFVNISF